MDKGPLRRIERTVPADDERRLAANRRSLGIILWQVLTTVESLPLPPPKVTEDFARLPPWLRVYECLRLFVLDLEFALSPQGQVRGILCFLLRAVILADAVLLALAAILGGTAVVTALGAVISRHLLTMALNCFWGLLVVLGCVVLLLVIVWLFTTVARLHGDNPGASGTYRG